MFYIEQMPIMDAKERQKSEIKMPLFLLKQNNGLPENTACLCLINFLIFKFVQCLVLLDFLLI